MHPVLKANENIIVVDRMFCIIFDYLYLHRVVFINVY